MANVRIDENGLPKAPVYESTAPAVHRTGVTAVDSADPADTTGAVDCAGYHHCRFDLALSGVSVQSLDVQVLLWNSRESLWFAGAKYTFTTTGQHALQVEARGCIIFLKVVAFSGTSFSLNMDYALS